jgi:hypothetical protein
VIEGAERILNHYQKAQAAYQPGSRRHHLTSTLSDHEDGGTRLRYKSYFIVTNVSPGEKHVEVVATGLYIDTLDGVGAQRLIVEKIIHVDG